MKTVVDSNVLIALLNTGDQHSDRASELLGRLRQEGGLFINSVVYSELATFFDSRDKLEEFMEDTGLRVEKIGRKASYIAGEKFSRYLENRGNGLQCPECGERNDIKCRKCSKVFSHRQHTAPDFLIGSHAKKQADRLASFDTEFNREYFPELKTVPR